MTGAGQLRPRSQRPDHRYICRAASGAVCGYQAGWWNFGARIEALKPTGEDAHHAKPRAPGVVVGRTIVLLPAQEQIDRDVISAFAVGELGKAAQDSFGEGQVVAKAAPDGDVLLEACG